MPEGREGSVPPKEHKEKKSENSEFFDFPVDVVEEKYSEPAGDYDKKRGIEKSYTMGTYMLRQELTDRMDDIIEQNEGELPDSFFQDATRLAEKYYSLDLGMHADHHKADAALITQQLIAIVGHPKFIKDEKSVAVMEEIAKIDKRNHEGTKPVPVDFHMYRDRDHEKRKLLGIKEGLGVDDIPALQRHIDNPKLWDGGYGKRLPQRFFSSLSEVICSMSEDNPKETLQARLSLLHYGSDYNSTEVLQDVVYAFKSEEDRAALKKITEDWPASRAAKNASKILSGEFANTAWFT